MPIDSSITNYNFNDNFLQANKFSVKIDGLPFTSYFCQQLIIPGVSQSEAVQVTQNSDVYHTGKMMYEPLTVTFLVDEDLRVWQETYNWMVGNTYPQDNSQYRIQMTERKGQYHDAIVTLHTNSTLDNLRFKFRNCFPVSLGPLNMDFSKDAKEPLYAELSLRFDYFLIERVTTNLQ